MSTFAVLYIIAGIGTTATPTPIAWFATMDTCKETSGWATAHQEGIPVQFTCVEYPSKNWHAL